jgi:hypothetical protein
MFRAYGKLDELEAAPSPVAPHGPAISYPIVPGTDTDSGVPPPGDQQLTDVMTSVDITVTPDAYPTPAVAWSVRDDSSDPNGPAVLMFANEWSRGATLGGMRPGRSTLIARIGPPISRDFTIGVRSFDELTLSARRAPRAVRFIGDRAVVAEGIGPSDLFISSDGVLHFPGGGAILTNGDDARLVPPRGARRGPAFTALQADAWHDDRRTVDENTWRGMNGACLFGSGIIGPPQPGAAETPPTHVERDDAPTESQASCDATMSANVIIFKIKLGYVKLHVLAYFDGGVRATYMVLHAGSGVNARDAFALPPEHTVPIQRASPHLAGRSVGGRGTPR